uniref:Annexin n=1 Tax=Globodera rostochiensis TaxID=31243 RepID=A0A914GTJ6_GLORO
MVHFRFQLLEGAEWATKSDCGTPSIIASPNFDAGATADLLRKMMKPIGCDKSMMLQMQCPPFGIGAVTFDVAPLCSGSRDERMQNTNAVKAAEDARRMHRAGEPCLGADEIAIRLVVTRSEIGMADIRKEYQEIYRKSLEAAIAHDCSRAYKAS